MSAIEAEVPFPPFSSPFSICLPKTLPFTGETEAMTIYTTHIGSIYVISGSIGFSSFWHPVNRRVTESIETPITDNVNALIVFMIFVLGMIKCKINCSVKVDGPS